jgi:hypothetical protein
MSCKENTETNALYPVHFPENWVSEPSKKLAWSRHQATGFLHDLLIDPEDGVNMILRNVGWLSPDVVISQEARTLCFLKGKR